MQSRSPTYPGIGLSQAIVLASKIHAKNRTNPIDREAAAKEMGYAGITGSSTKALADLQHYSLIEKAGKGSVRVSQNTVDILYPVSPAGKVQAMREAAFSPSLFQALHKHFHDGLPSENALKGYLIREKFITSVIPQIVAGYTDTCRLLERESGTESHGQANQSPENEAGRQDVSEPADGHAPPPAAPEVRQQGSLPPAPRQEGVKLMTGERELTTGLLSKGAGFRLIVHGKVGEKELDRLIRKLQLDKEILAEADDTEEEND